MKNTKLHSLQMLKSQTCNLAVVGEEKSEVSALIRPKDIRNGDLHSSSSA